METIINTLADLIIVIGEIMFICFFIRIIFVLISKEKLN